jgi:outer membrane protease
MKIYFSGIIIVFCILGSSLYAHASFRDEVITQALDKQERPDIDDMGSKMNPMGLFPNLERGRVIETTLGKLEFTAAVGVGYLAGDTRYEIDFSDSGINGKSELVFPFNKWLAGGNVSAGYYPFYLNFQGWTNIAESTSSGMTDKDWADGFLFSSTKSDYKAQVSILDVNLLYNFWEGKKPWGDMSNSFQKGRFGLLIGYRYENFKYDIIGVKDLFTDISYYDGQKVLDYKVQYHIPYLGLNWQYSNDLVDKIFDNWGLNIQACASPYVIAKDRDDHVLRNKLMEGDNKGYALLMGLNTFLKIKNNWIARCGFDYTGIWTDGKQNQHWYGDDPASPGDDTGSSIEGIKLKINSSQYLFWGLLQYHF